MSSLSGLLRLFLQGLVLVSFLAAGSYGLWTFAGSTGASPQDLGRPGARGGMALLGESLQPIAPARGLNPEKVALGRTLFHDPRLSRDNSISCASCHDLSRGGGDQRSRSVGVDNREGGINAPTVFNAALNFRQFWDGRSPSLEDQVSGPVHNPLEMASSWQEVLPKLLADAQLVQRFQGIYQRPPEAILIQDAIAEFERSLLTPSRVDRWLLGDTTALSNEEQAGFRLFKRHGCVACHQGANVGGNMYQRFGVMRDYFAGKQKQTSADLGRFNVSGREEDLHVFKVPSLRNVALTAPYFHDASAETLEEAVSQMGRYQLGVDLPEEDVGEIVLFLRALTGEHLP